MSSEYEVEKSYQNEEFVAELRRLADALESGEEFSFEIDGETVTIPAGALASVEYELEDGSAELEFQLRWEVEESEEGEEEEYSDEDSEDEKASEAA